MGFFSKPQDQVDFDALKDRVAKLEAAVASLQSQAASSVPSGPSAPAAAPADPATGEPAWMAEVRALKSQGKTIHAIKLYRESTGLGLKEAKDVVEALY